MDAQPPHFSQMDVDAPDFEELEVKYAELVSAIESREPVGPVLEMWDGLRRGVATWRSLSRLRFKQDTTDERARAAREHVDELMPRITELDIELKRACLARREELADAVPEHAFALWEADVTTFESTIQDGLVRESKLEAEYDELRASAEIEFDGRTLNLSEIRAYTEHRDRDVRHAAEKARWEWWAGHGEAFDRIYDELVEIRTGMARTLGFDDYVGLGYQRMQRVDYGPDDVARFRNAVVEHVVPLVSELRETQRADLGVDRLMAWDEPVLDPDGNPEPDGERDDLVRHAGEMFDAMGDEIGSFFRMMDDRELLDLAARRGKAGGGFCTFLAGWGVPFIFANFNGTKGDVEVFTHEMGHAFQVFASRDNEPYDLVWPTMESCEIHSMSLEFFTWPHMDGFFGDDADRFRRIHLTESLTFLPYGCAVDHFQHLVYADPEASSADRHAMWQQMEARYLPWRDWGDLDYPAGGGRWQMQGHIYSGPFYYIDYVLAMTCALQFFARMEDDYDAAFDDYVALCRRGGEAPFQELARSAGLTSPFEPGALPDAVARAREWLATADA